MFSIDKKLSKKLPGFDPDGDRLKWSIVDDNGNTLESNRGIYDLGEEVGKLRLISSRGTFTFTPSSELRADEGKDTTTIGFNFKVVESYKDSPDSEEVMERESIHKGSIEVVFLDPKKAPNFECNRAKL